MYNEYEFLIKNIINNEEFNKLEKEKHHGTNRLIHSKRVSYYSYRTKWDRFKLIFTHPIQAVKKSKKLYHLNPKEENIIISHMFPLGIPPKYLESWIVQGVDKVIATYEFIEAISATMYIKKEYIRELVKQN